MTYIGYINIEKISEKDIKKFLNVVSKEEKIRITRLIQEKDRIRSLIGKVLLFYIINKFWGNYDKPLEFGYNTYGKPYIKDSFLKFNISHSSDMVVCGVSDKGEVGIDIEKVSTVNTEEYQAVLTKEEYKIINQKKELFYTLWIVKEAIMKAEGKGFFLNPLSFTVFDEKGNERKEIFIIDTKWYIYKSEFNNSEYKMAIALNNKEIPIWEEVKLFC